jgi:hypothetical protein
MLTFEITDSEGFVLVRLEGLVSLDAWDAVLHKISAALVARDGPRRLLIDMKPALGYLGIPERRALGAMMAQRLGMMQKVAILVQAEKITNVVHDEAHRLGLDLSLFAESGSAVAWVTSPSGS